MDDLLVQGERTSVLIPARALSWTASRASGPGGQNVNKVSSKVELCLDLEAAVSLSEAAKTRLRALAAGAFDASGRLRVVSQVTRDQSRNLIDARNKLADLIARALVVPKRRKATKPTRGSQERRLQAKREGSEKKRARRSFDD